VCLTVSDSVGGCSNTFCDTVIISNATTSTCNVTANFSYTTGASGLVGFNNTSTGTGSFTTYSWNFGNGTSSNATNPFATYASNGIYNVCLTVSDSIGGCSNTFCDTVIISSVITGIANNKLENIDYSIYPNPNNGVFEVKLNTSITDNGVINVYDLIGNLVYSTVIDSNNLVKTINLPNVSNGVYFVKVSSNDSQHTKKIIINK
jgi:PKD repeat protein